MKKNFGSCGKTNRKLSVRVSLGLLLKKFKENLAFFTKNLV